MASAMRSLQKFGALSTRVVSSHSQVHRMTQASPALLARRIRCVTSSRSEEVESYFRITMHIIWHIGPFGGRGRESSRGKVPRYHRDGLGDPGGRQAILHFVSRDVLCEVDSYLC